MAGQAAAIIAAAIKGGRVVSKGLIRYMQKELAKEAARQGRETIEDVKKNNEDNKKKEQEKQEQKKIESQVRHWTKEDARSKMGEKDYWSNPLIQKQVSTYFRLKYPD